jgi:hypothetical protein
MLLAVQEAAACAGRVSVLRERRAVPGAQRYERRAAQ